ncbi:hypothetical protein BASA81_001429 [Batrachochytrium salamandrivorans]|nr:hypothetical protein BASA81_001429 [Batrachochytrium salamandrivorans]
MEQPLLHSEAAEEEARLAHELAEKETEQEKKDEEAAMAFQLEETNKPLRGYFAIYTEFATRQELGMVAIGVCAALVNGAVQPMMAVLLGRIWGGQAGRSADALQHNVNANLKYMFLMAVVSFLANYLQYTCFMITSERINQRMKRACLSALFRQEIGFFDENPSGLLSARISEQSILVQRGTSENLGMAVQFTAQLVVGFIISFTNNYHVALAMLLCMPVIAVVLSGLIFGVVYFVNKSTKAYEEAGAVAEEVLRAIQTVVSFNAESRLVDKYNALLAVAESVSIRMWFVRAGGMGVIMSTVFLSLGVGYCYGAQLVSRGSVDFGGVLTSVMSAMMASMSLGMMGPILGVLAQAKSGSSVLFKLIDRDPKLVDGTLIVQDSGEIRGEVEFRNVAFAYPTRKQTPALNGLSFVVKPGQTCSLTGESGCGKSSAIQLFMRFYDPDSGQVLLDGVDVREYTMDTLRGLIGFVNQEPVLWDQSIADNIRMGKHNATMDEVTLAAKAADAHDFISRLPNGYLTRVSASVLSGGQKQRIAIARALVRDPKILVLDEATSALDEKSQQTVQLAIDQLLRPTTGPRRTAMVIAHRLSTIRYSDVIVVLENKNNTGGKVVEVGNHEQLMAIPNGTYARLVSIQEAKPPSEPSSKSTGTAPSSPRTLVRQSSLSMLVAQHEGALAFNSMLGASMASPQPLSRQMSSYGMDDDDEDGGEDKSEKLLGSDYHALVDDMGVSNAMAGTSMTAKVGQEDSELYVVPMSRLWKLSAPESPWWFVLGFMGAILKGSTQPLLSIVISHVMSHMILIPEHIDGIRRFSRCETSSDCKSADYCFHIPGFDFAGKCVRTCLTNSDCDGQGMCTKFASLGISESFCVTSWMDGHSPDDVKHTGVVALEIYGLVGLVTAIAVASQVFAFGYIGEKLVRRIRLVVFSSICRQDGAFFDDSNNAVGALISRLATDATMIRTLTCDFVGLIVENSIALTVAVCIAVASSWRFSLLFLVAAPMLSAATYWQSRQLTAQNTKSQDALKASSSILSEAVGNVRTVFSFNAQTKLVSLYNASLEQPKLAGIKNAHVCGLGSGMSQFVFFSVYAIGFMWGSYLIGQGLLDSPDLSRAFMAITMTAATVGQASARSNDYTKAKISTSNVFRIADRRPRIEALPDVGVVIANLSQTGALIRYEQVSFAYPSRPEVKVLNGLDFEARPGQTVAFVGGSGCGKSSIIKLLFRFYDCEDNLDSRITVNGTDLRDLNLAWFRSQVGLVGQEPVLFRGTIRDNLLWGDPNATDGFLRDCLQSANAWDFVQKFPLGLDTSVGANAKDLSGGQKQRIAIARALVKRPTILCLDEATSALDSESEKVVQHALDQLLQDKTSKRTTFVIAHRLQSIRHSDKIVVLGNVDGRGGRVLEQGTHEELLDIPSGQYRQMWQVTIGEKKS